MRKRTARAALLAVAACMAFALCACTGSYSPESKTPSVDPSALSSPGTLKVGVDASSYPFAGQARGSLNGIDVDVAAALADEMGLELELVDIGMNGAASLASGEVDMVMGLDKAKTPPEQCWTSEPYLDSCAALFAPASSTGSPSASSSPVIAAQAQSLSAYMVSQLYGASALKAETELKTVFQDLVQGAAGYCASDAVVGSYMVNSLDMDAHIVGLMEEPSGYCIGVPASNTTLQLALTQALSSLEGNGVLGIVMTRWLGDDLDLSGIELVEPLREQQERQRQEAEEAERAAAEAEAAAAAEAAEAEAAQAAEAPADEAQ